MTRREPVRTCVACRGTGAKRDLVRVVRGPDGAVAVDASGRAPGRGAYVHRRAACVDGALSRRAVWRALRTDADAETTARLRHEIERELRS